MKDTVFYWSAFTPLLLLTWVFQHIPGLRRWWGLAAATMLAVLVTGVVLLPWMPAPLPWWSASLSADFSIVMAALMLIAILQRASGCTFLTRCEWQTAWIFGACAAVVLYSSAFGLGPQNFDAYALGWPWLFWRESLWLFGSCALVAAFLTWRGNRFGYLLLLAVAAHIGRFQESENFWDYIVDPLYAAVSLMAVFWILGSRVFRRASSRP